jgi:hypothetical protein
MKCLALTTAVVLALSATASQAETFMAQARVTRVDTNSYMEQLRIPQRECTRVDLPVYDQTMTIISYRREEQCTETFKIVMKEKIKNYLVHWDWNGYHGQFYSQRPYFVDDTFTVNISVNPR